MRFCITIIQDEDGMFIAECPSIPGCISQGKPRRKQWKTFVMQSRIVSLFVRNEECRNKYRCGSWTLRFDANG
jgi:hypothetical protein